MNNDFDKDLYKILELDRECSYDDIKRNYRRLAIQYHPDKNPDIDTTEKFISIKLAYEVLSDPIKRDIYDKENDQGKEAIYDNLSELIKDIVPNEFHLFVDIFFQNNFGKIIETFINDYHKEYQKKHQINFNNLNNIQKPSSNDLHIETDIFASMNEKYNNRYRRLLVKRKTRSDTIISVPLRNKIFVLKNEGEIIDSIKGDIIINIHTIDVSNTCIINDNNIYVTHEIGLYNWLYGGIENVNVFDEDITIEHNGFIEKLPMIELDDYGMPYESINESNNNNEIYRGKLIVMFKIKGLYQMQSMIMDVDQTINNNQY